MEPKRIVLLHNAMIVTVDHEKRVFRNGAIVVEGDKLAAVGQSPEILHDFSASAHEILDLQGRVLLPGPFVSNQSRRYSNENIAIIFIDWDIPILLCYMFLGKIADRSRTDTVLQVRTVYKFW